MLDLLWWLLLITFITGSSFGTERSPPCPANQFFNDANGVCCLFCPRGTYMDTPCHHPGSNPLCFVCKIENTYMDEQSNMTTCKECRVCDPETEVEEKECDIYNNQQCVCREGFYMKGNECVMESTTGSETGSASNKCPPWWFWVLLIVILLIMLFIFLFVKRCFCPKAHFTFDKNGRSSKRDAIKTDEEPDRLSEVVS
uniref:tumor necrosis factor receptor superfamily member 6-like isoform X3 n=1 Tax=Myxine glutinosa TaxID=7769 RepID=UPI00358DDFD5